jgi:hypothetical protein
MESVVASRLRPEGRAFAPGTPCPLIIGGGPFAGIAPARFSFRAKDSPNGP